MRHFPVIAVTLALISCSGDGETRFCGDREELQTSFQALRDVNIVDDGIEAFDAALDALIADLSTLRASGTELESQVDALSSALQDLQTAVGAAATPEEKVTAAVDRLDDVSVTWQALDEAGVECD